MPLGNILAGPVHESIERNKMQGTIANHDEITL
jgi:hypothetical protein